jgi:single-strand DNA-binding protein
MPEGVNKVILVGNLGQDPELRYTQSGLPVARLRIATTESFLNREGEKQSRTEWHTIVVWGKQGESCNRYLSKGRQVYIEGRLQTRTWEDKEGIKRTTTEINANRVVFLGGAQREELEAPQVPEPGSDIHFEDKPPVDSGGSSSDDEVPF